MEDGPTEKEYLSGRENLSLFFFIRQFRWKNYSRIFNHQISLMLSFQRFNFSGKPSELNPTLSEEDASAASKLKYRNWREWRKIFSFNRLYIKIRKNKNISVLPPLAIDSRFCKFNGWCANNNRRAKHQWSRVGTSVLAKVAPENPNSQSKLTTLSPITCLIACVDC